MIRRQPMLEHLTGLTIEPLAGASSSTRPSYADRSLWPYICGSAAGPHSVAAKFTCERMPSDPSYLLSALTRSGVNGPAPRCSMSAMLSVR